MQSENNEPPKGPSKFRVNTALAGFLLIAAFFLAAEHRAHILGFFTEHKSHLLNALPYLFLLLCPLLHIFMHGGSKGGHGHSGHGKD